MHLIATALRFGLLIFAVLFLFYFSFNQSISAQDLDEVTISGRVADQNGAIIPGATVTAILVGENIENLYRKMKNFVPPALEKWLDESST